MKTPKDPRIPHAQGMKGANPPRRELLQRRDRSGKSAASPNDAERLRAMIEASVDCVITIDAESTIIEFNAAAERTFGYARADVIGKPLAETIIPPALREAHRRGMAALLNGRPGKLLGKRTEMPAMRLDGSEFPVELTVTRIASQSPPLFTAYLRDITERKRDEQKLRESESKYRELVELTHDLVWAVDTEGRITYMSPASRRIYGREPEEMIGRLHTDFVPPEESSRGIAKLAEMITTGEPVCEVEARIYHRDGHEVVLSANAVAQRDGAGNIVGITGTSRDITQNKLEEEKLRESETRFRELAENIREVFWMSDPENTRIIYISPAYETIWGRSRVTLYASPSSWMEAIHPDDRERMLQTRAGRDSTKPHDNTYRIVRPDGAVRWIRDRGFPVRDERGAVVRFAGIAGDITEQKRAEERLREYEKVVEGSEEMIAVVDRDYRYLLANRAFLKYRDASLESVIGRRIDELLNPGVFEHVIKEKLDQAFAGKTIQHEMQYTYPSRGNRDLSISYLPIEGADGIDRVACVLHDVTDRKQAEEELRRSEEKFKTLFNIAPVGIAFLDSAMNIVDCNCALERMSGLSRKQLLGTAWRQRTFLNPDHSPRLGRERATERGVLGKQYVSGVETGAVLENGDIVWAEVSVAPLAMLDASAVVIMHDITERKKAHEQLRVLSRRLFQVQEEERRHLARELHDEIGQALTAVKINLAPTKRGEAAPSSVRLQEATALVDNLIRQVRQISLDLHPSLLDDLGLAPALRSLLEEQTRRAGLRAQFSAADPLEEIGREIQTTAFRIAQEAITNVLRHGRAEFIALFVVTDENELRMKIVDDGIGFDVAKTNGHGAAKRTTFGLTGMKERAALLGGNVTITSSAGQGTTVEMTLPITENGSTPAAD